MGTARNVGWVLARIGIFGGTFDPPHIGHLLIATEARAQLDLDEVWLMVAADPWQKAGTGVTAAQDRWDLVCAAVEGLDGLVPSDLELRRGGPTYTMDTVEELGDRDLVLILGSDAARGLPTWHRADELASRVPIAVASRAGEPVPKLPGWRMQSVDLPAVDVSSTDLRARVASGRPIDVLVPPAVAVMVRQRGLYRLGG